MPLSTCYLSIPRTHTHSSPPPLLKGILDVYRYTLSQIEFYGPTNFSTFLDKATEYATGGISQEAQSYHILLIITVRKGWGMWRGLRGVGRREKGKENSERATCKGFGHHQEILTIAYSSPD